MKTRTVFHENSLERQLSEDGYVKLPFFSSDEVQKCLEIFNAFPISDVTTAFYTTHWTKDKTYRKEISDELEKIIPADRFSFLVGYKPVYYYFLVKYPGKEGKFGAHQDWSLVDETEHRGVTCWTPLQIIDPTNGAFHVMPGSHLLFDNIRGYEVQFPYHNAIEDIEKDYMNPVYADAGETIAFDQRLIHYSPANHSDAVRVSVGTVLIPSETTLHHYRKNELSNTIDCYRTDDDFLKNFGFEDSLDQGEFQLLRSVESQCSNLSRSEVQKVLASAGFKASDSRKKKSKWRQVFGLGS